MILSGFGNVLIGNTMATCLESNYQVNKMHCCKLMFFSCFKLQFGVEFLPSIIARIFCRNHLKHFLKKSVLASSVLFAVTTSCKLWIVKLANKENLFSLDFLKIRSKKVLIFWKEYNCDPEFFAECVCILVYYKRSW